jgi:hypothetical protein
VNKNAKSDSGQIGFVPQSKNDRLTVSNRLNAALSTGPRTAEGKARSARNSLRHGLASRAIVVPGLERQEQWEEHLEATIDDVAPTGYIEHVLAERVAMALWRLARVTRYERGMIEAAQGDLEWLIEEREIRRTEARALEDALAALARISAPSSSLGTPALDVVAAGVCVGALRDAMEMQEAPNEDDGVEDSIYGGQQPTVAAMGAWLHKSAAAAGVHVDMVIKDACESLAWRLRKTRVRLDATEQDLEIRRAVRAIPDEGICDRVARFEAHLERSLARSLGELDRARQRRLEERDGRDGRDGKVLALAPVLQKKRSAVG